MDKVNGVISERDFIEMTAEFSSERNRLELCISNLEQELNSIDENIGEGDNLQERIEQYISPKHLTREMVETMIDYIYVGKRIPRTRDVPIEIHWIFNG